MYGFKSLMISWPTVIEGDTKAFFSIANTPRCRGGRYSIFWIVPFTLDPYLIMLSVKQGSIKYFFLAFCMTRLGIEPRTISDHSNYYANRPVIIIIFSKWLNSSIGPIDWTLTGTTIPDQSGPESNSNKEQLQISQNFKTGAWPSDAV